MKIEVRQKHIRKAVEIIKNKTSYILGFDCPVAQAISELSSNCMVGYEEIKINQIYVKTPSKVKEFINLFDRGNYSKLKPFSFEIKDKLLIGAGKQK